MIEISQVLYTSKHRNSKNQQKDQQQFWDGQNSQTFWFRLFGISWKTTPSVKKLLQKGHFKGQLKGWKNVEFAATKNRSIFDKWIDRMCVAF